MRCLVRRGRILTAAALLAACTAAGCSRQLPAEQVVWAPGGAGRELRGAYGAGGVATDAQGTWLAYDEETAPGAWQVHALYVPRATGGETPATIAATFAGRAPSVLVQAGRAHVLTAMAASGSPPALVLRTASADRRTWSAPRDLGVRLAAAAPGGGRLLCTARGTWICPLTRTDDSAGAARNVVCLRSTDGGTTWTESTVCTAPALADPVCAESSAGNLLLVARLGGELARSTSQDDGLTWSALQPIAASTDTLPPALGGFAGGVALAWTDAPPDTSWAVPGLRAVRLAFSTDDGATWQAAAPLAWAAGRTPWVTSLSIGDGRLTALLRRAQGASSTLDCVAYALDELRAPVAERPPTRRAAAADPVRAAHALELWCEHTLARPETSIRLFIEGYFMRSLVAAYEVLHGGPSVAGPVTTLPPGARLLDTQAGLARAVSFADWMLSGQDAAGYWPLGYKALYVADMAAVTGLFAALIPHVDAAHAQRYEAAAVKFAAALARDGMLLPSGACGVGWVETRAREESLAIRDPYLVSTGLAGIELHAWLYARTHNERYRQRALAAIDYTLSALRPDGSFPAVQLGPSAEGAYLAAAYVQEGWMAADLFLQDDAVLGTLRQGLKAHVAWLVRTQNPDGTWGGRGADGEWARTPPIVNFLIWYDRRCETSPDVRAAVRRASITLGDPDAWRDLGLARRGKNQEVMRALAGRTLAALAKGDFVF